MGPSTLHVSQQAAPAQHSPAIYRRTDPRERQRRLCSMLLGAGAGADSNLPVPPPPSPRPPCLPYAANPPHIPLASTHMRNQMLEMQGWQVVSIPFNTWAKLAGLQEKQASSSDTGRQGASGSALAAAESAGCTCRCQARPLVGPWLQSVCAPPAHCNPCLLCCAVLLQQDYLKDHVLSRLEKQP